MKLHEEENNELLIKRKIQKNDLRNKICICLSNSRYEAIRRVARQLGYKLVKESELWNICWTDSCLSVEFYKDMRRFQKVNHFPGMFEICRKDLLARNLNRMLRIFPLDYQIFPKTWCFPADLGEAIAYSKLHKSKTFILKPDQGSQGKGIWLTKNLKEIKPTDRLICQIYINKPLLIDGYKFDLRIYALITSIDPLRIFVYNEGLARFATSKYKEPHIHNVSNMFMHLTNYSVNKHSRTYQVDQEYGTKRKFSTINKILSGEGYNVTELWANIDDIVVKTILSAYPMLKHNYSACFPGHDLIQACFEILGIDILIDNKLKPYILEVNHSPSFHTDETIDREVKDALLRDTFNILQISIADKKRVLDEDKKRVKTRLLQKINNCDKEMKQSRCTIQSNESQITSSTMENLENNTKVQKDMNKIWETQIEWENTHMGGYRRIMPPKYGDTEKYSQFFISHQLSSIYSDTAASKRREECARQQRKKLLEEQFQKSKFKLQSIAEGNIMKPKKRKKIKDPIVNLNEISAIEEKERIDSLAQRDILVRNCGLIQYILMSFFKHNLLTASDKKKYCEIFSKIQSNHRDKYMMSDTNKLLSLFNNYSNERKPNVIC